jgi:LacI family transcriptional regulator, repressor for deo operon, udp, cdd, tsx, nupC, and nupG
MLQYGSGFRMSSERVTIDDIAKHTGYSRATISRVINQEGSVRPATAERVQAAITALGYVPNTMASALSGGRTRVVAVLLPDIGSPYYSDLLEGIDRVALERGYHIVLKTKQRPKEVLSLVESGLADGFIIRHSRDPEDDRALIGELKQRDIPFIFIGKPLEGSKSHSIMVDNVGGAREMAHHFADHAFRTVLFISGSRGNLDSRDREYGFRLGLSERGFDLSQLFVEEGDFSRECGYQRVEEFFAHRKVDAVFAANDRMALGVLFYCHEHELRVPDDVAVAGFDDVFFSEFLWPPLTTVMQPMHEIGTVAMENMIMSIEGSKISTTQIILPTRLVVRKSCGCGSGRPAANAGG